MSAAELPMVPTYATTQGKNRLFVPLASACPTLTFRKAWLDKKYQPTDPTETPFGEVEMMSLQRRMPPEFLPLLDPLEETRENFQAHIILLTEALLEYFRCRLESDEKYICFHSSGYDSRIVSGTLAVLRNEGFSLPHIHFRCHVPEEDAFFAIMKTQGWKKDQYSGHAGSDYKHAAQSVANGWVSFWLAGLNFWDDIAPLGEEQNWSVITGSGGGELFSYRARNKVPPRSFRFCRNPDTNRWLNFLPREGDGYSTRFEDMLFPFSSYLYLEKALRTSSKWIVIPPGRVALDKVRKGMLEELGKRLGKDLIGCAPNIGHAPTRTLLPEVIQAGKQRWVDSSFRKRYGKHAEVASIQLFNIRDAHSRVLHGFASCYDEIVRQRRAAGLSKIGEIG